MVAGALGLIAERLHRLLRVAIQPPVIRQKHTREDHRFEIEFLDPEVQAHAFTFG